MLLLAPLPVSNKTKKKKIDKFLVCYLGKQIAGAVNVLYENECGKIRFH